MTLAMVDSSSGAALGGGDEPGHGLGRRGQDEHAAGEGADVVELEAEPGHDAEVASPTPDRPEQVGVVLGVDLEEVAVGRDDLGCEQVVDGHAELADEVADAAAERDPGDPDGAGVAETDRQAVLPDRRRVLAGGQARLRPGGPPVDVDVERLHVGHVDDQTARRSCCGRRRCGRRTGRPARGRSPGPWRSPSRCRPRSRPGRSPRAGRRRCRARRVGPRRSRGRRP